jgi:hypothetical protein
MEYGSDEASEVKALSDLSHSFEQSVEIFTPRASVPCLEGYILYTHL